MGSLPTSFPVHEQLAQSFEKHRDTLERLNREIHTHPELSFQEFHAHDTFCTILSELEYKVTRHAYGLKTAFEVESGHGGAVITYNAEYDALPEIGHACGHNLISTSSLAAFLATADALAEGGIEGRVRLLGTPAEEDGGGKIDLLNAGAYKGVDACLMGHPAPSSENLDGIVLMRCMARASTKVTFRGLNAHAGDAPWKGKNALDAAVATYNNLSMLRQQTPPNQRIHAIISNGGDRPNIIPHLTEMLIYIRAETDAELQETCRKLVACCEGAATATGCTVGFDWANTYKDLQCSNAIATRFEQMAASQGQSYMRTSPTVSGGSTDQGNVGYELPALHPSFSIPVEVPGVGPHNPGFQKAAASPAGFDAALRFGKVLAATGLEILQDKSLRDEMWAEHRATFGKTKA
ncbi:Peptidase M20 domain-containing protein 2 [Pleurostoma richardsiae]|uniref:Peptidase M20 domain-containing protein 2 n=1 Tax=Pleurostoma richardsiae TaxID=41990 RepID=A0AA38RXZ6_9PEZI|nr:Peptidase M20 domain-containing protein 2 [Pleurostoma richardsiae]